MKAAAKLGILAGLTVGLGACAGSQPGPGIPVWDNAVDMRNCHRIQAVSEPTRTDGLFGPAVDAMVARTLAVGGTDLYLHKNGSDWSNVTGIAYRCGSRAPRAVISVRG